MPKDPYNILGVSRSANTDEIKRAYRKLAHEHHPDKGGDQEKFKEINEAYQTLSDESKRQQYDQFGATFDGASGGNPFGAGFNPFRRGAQGFNVRFEGLEDVGDIFSQFFGDASPFGSSTRARAKERERGTDLAIEMTIPFEDMAFGTKRELPLRRLRTCERCKGNLAEPGTKIVSCATCGGSGVVERQSQTLLGAFVQRTVCPTCHGEGKAAAVPCKMCRGEGRTQRQETLVVTIPPGIEDGTRLRIAGEGEAPAYGGAPGDLYVHVRVKPHKEFLRDGHDLRSRVEVPFTVAALGGSVPVGTIDGEEQVTVPKGTPSGAELRLKGKGIFMGRHGTTGKRGDHVVTVSIEVPKKLTKRQEELLREFGATGGKRTFGIF